MEPNYSTNLIDFTVCFMTWLLREGDGTEDYNNITPEWILDLFEQGASPREAAIEWLATHE